MPYSGLKAFLEKREKIMAIGIEGTARAVIVPTYWNGTAAM
jgi:hypothetical protein